MILHSYYPPTVFIPITGWVLKDSLAIVLDLDLSEKQGGWGGTACDTAFILPTYGVYSYNRMGVTNGYSNLIGPRFSKT